MVQLRSWLLSSLAAIHLHTTGVGADGTGLIGYGKTLYNPTCSFACRNVIRKQTLECTPSSSTENHGTAHNPVSTPPKCFVQDHVFLKTMALCIDTYCSLSDKPSISLIEDYWSSHLGTGTLGTPKHVPVLSYADALAAARKDEEDFKSTNATISASEKVPEGLVPYKVSSPLPLTTGGSSALNRTSMVSPAQWQLQYNYMSDFETNEKGHSTMTIIIAIVAIFLPIFLSLFRFIPGSVSNRGWSYLKSKAIYPAIFGRHHREPIVGGMVPTRGQSLYIAFLSFLNIILLLAPYTITRPQASFTTLELQTISIVGNRAGVMAMGNVVAIFLFSSRNNPLLYLTDWSYSTYLLLHRWLGYWVVIHTVIHSAMLWAHYVKVGSYADEILRLYWQWGIVGTVAVCALFPLSILKIRQKFYEIFIVSHVALSLLFLIGYYYHIWYVYTYNWGYEIWMFVAAGIWALERLIRIGRMVFQRSRTAVVTVIPDTDGEYIRIDVEGKDLKGGVAYLCFPTLSWRFWESHPFSVSGSLSEMLQDLSRPSQASSVSEGNAAPDEKVDMEKAGAPTAANPSSVQDSITGTTFFARVRGGVTQALGNRASASDTNQIRLRVLIDGPYEHSGHIHSQIAKCTSVLCIAGGVGITACLPLLRQVDQKQETRFFFSSRKHGLAASLTPALNTLPPNVKVETLVGQRFDLGTIIHRELAADVGATPGPLAIVVSGPPGLADDVRHKVTQIARDNRSCRAYILVDEAFSW